MFFQKKKWVFYILISISIAACIVFILFNNYYFIYTVEGKSMEPVLNNFDRILIRKINDNVLKRFDLIVFKKINNSKSLLLIKRVIGMPGENIEIIENVIYINGIVLRQPFLKTINKRDIVKDPKTLPLIKIPENSFYLIGDNRDLSKDSRYFGVINKKNIIGKVLFSYWPFKIVN